MTFWTALDIIGMGLWVGFLLVLIGGWNRGNWWD